MNAASPIILVTGVAGSGKTTFGRALAQRLGYAFIDADDHHPPENLRRMKAGQPLSDPDRQPWLATLHTLLQQRQRECAGVVLACSLLKQAYRERIRRDLKPVHLFFLRGVEALITRRLAERTDHFFPPSLLASQFAALEEPTDAVVLAADQPVICLVEEAIAYLTGALEKKRSAGAAGVLSLEPGPGPASAHDPKCSPPRRLGRADS